MRLQNVEKQNVGFRRRYEHKFVRSEEEEEEEEEIHWVEFNFQLNFNGYLNNSKTCLGFYLLHKVNVVFSLIQPCNQTHEDYSWWNIFFPFVQSSCITLTMK